MNRERAGWKVTVPTSTRLEDLVLEALVVHLEVVVGAEVAVVVEIDVEVNAAAEQAGGTEIDVVVEPRGLEAAAAAGVGIEKLDRAAALVPHPVGSELEADLAIDPEIGVLPGEAQRSPPRRFGRLLSGARLDRLAVEHEHPLGPVPVGPSRVERGADERVPGGGANSRRHPGASQPGRRERAGWLKTSQGRIELEADPRLWSSRGARIDILSEQERWKQEDTREGD